MPGAKSNVAPPADTLKVAGPFAKTTVARRASAGDRSTEAGGRAALKKYLPAARGIEQRADEVSRPVELHRVARRLHRAAEHLHGNRAAGEAPKQQPAAFHDESLRGRVATEPDACEADGAAREDAQFRIRAGKSEGARRRKRARVQHLGFQHRRPLNEAHIRERARPVDGTTLKLQNARREIEDRVRREIE